MNIRFEQATSEHVGTIFSWLSEPHMQEFWDNSQEHRDDILNFVQGRPQHYFSGTTKYWIGYVEDEPYAFLLSDVQEKDQPDMPKIQREHMSIKGKTISLDFGIGNKKYLGCGLGASTLCAFMDFYHDQIDEQADTFFIDPDGNNPKAMRVYTKAGFVKVGQFAVTKGYFVGHKSDLMVRKRGPAGFSMP